MDNTNESDSEKEEDNEELKEYCNYTNKGNR